MTHYQKVVGSNPHYGDHFFRHHSLGSKLGTKICGNSTFISIGQIWETKVLADKFWSRIESYCDIKGTFCNKNIFWKGPAGILKKLAAKNMPAGTRLGSAALKSWFLTWSRLRVSVLTKLKKRHLIDLNCPEI